jgi:hypothetical protein
MWLPEGRKALDHEEKQWDYISGHDVLRDVPLSGMM